MNAKPNAKPNAKANAEVNAKARYETSPKTELNRIEATQGEEKNPPAQQAIFGFLVNLMFTNELVSS